MLMAAGLGTRLRPFTDIEPKALLPLMGIPMAQFAVDQLVSSGVTRIVANIHHQAERAKKGFMNLDLGNASLVLSDESGLLLGSAGGLREAKKNLGAGPFYYVNADVLCNIDLRALAGCHARLRRRWGITMTLALFESAPVGGRYREVFFDRSAELITGLGELKEQRTFFASVAVLEPEALEGIPPKGPADFVPAILEPAIRNGKAGGFLTSARWNDVGSPALWLKAHSEVISQLETHPVPLWRERIESINKRIAPQVWMPKRTGHSIGSAGWSGPAYWNPLDEKVESFPREFGPQAVVYGRFPDYAEMSNLISFRGLSAHVNPSDA